MDWCANAMKIHVFRQQAGDTIVEVLIAVAIVSLVLVGAYASTNHNVRATQDTQEHSEALQLVQSQLEFLRANGPPNTGDTCYDKNGASANGGNCQVAADGTTTGAGPKFTMSIAVASGLGTCNTAIPTYQVKATWESLISSGGANVSMCYRSPSS